MRPPRILHFTDKKFYGEDFKSPCYTKLEFNGDGIHKVFLKIDGKWYTNGEKITYKQLTGFLNSAGETYGIESAQLITHVLDPYMTNPNMIRVPRSFEYRIDYSPIENPPLDYVINGENTKYVGCKNYWLSVTPVGDDRPMWDCDIF